MDPRSAADVASQIQRLLVNYLHKDYKWNSKADGGEIGRALTEICAYYSGLVIDRLNGAPQKHFLAFLDRLGNSLIPATAARTPLTFLLDPGAPGGRPVPAGTQVQAEGTDAAGRPLLFETESDLWLSPFLLKGLLLTSPPNRTQDLSQLLTRESGAGNAPASLPSTSSLTLHLALEDGRQPEVGRALTVYLLLDPLLYDSTAASGAGTSRVLWHYSAGEANRGAVIWMPLAIDDGTDGLNQSGMVSFLVPAGFKPAASRFQVRATLPTFRGAVPRLRAVWVNTVPAHQAVTIREEILGSSDGTADQVFRSFRRPVLAEEVLEVLEVRPGGASEIEVPLLWTRWREVSDFHGSKPFDRHYVIDRSEGTIRFGNGRQGLIPPPGARNVRLASYRSGGGLAGNIPAGTATTPVAAGRYIAEVFNPVAASGGAEGETTAALLQRAPRSLRHRFRAVAEEDYEDLARLASTEVARARCVPLIDLATDPVKVIRTLDDERAGAGRVSLIIVPRSAAPNPLPSLELLRHVREKLLGQASAAATISVVGPLYLRVKATVRIRLRSPRREDLVRATLKEALADWLHPLTGRGGEGWAFGREPQPSDIHRLIAELAIEGVDHVGTITVAAVADDVANAGWAQNLNLASRTAKVRESGRFLVCSGVHTIETMS
ncbi:MULTISPECIES: putative baseplate assembly protein [unclassified Cyanobium]|uniref:putative baseplate assembly protein n=1 Tax=unclassified Cyanobium TaxID=2627006 RepID=UPI0020CE1858|nr:MULTISPECIES: putative baseplate assembly protein [unclassified Cyanobium]